MACFKFLSQNNKKKGIKHQSGNEFDKRIKKEKG